MSWSPGSERVKSETLLVTTIYFDFDKSLASRLLQQQQRCSFFSVKVFFSVLYVTNKNAVGNEVCEKPPFRNQVSNMFIVQLNNFP